MDTEELYARLDEAQNDIQNLIKEAIVQLKEAKPDPPSEEFDDWYDRAQDIARLYLLFGDNWYSSEVSCETYYVYEHLFC